MVQHLHLRYGDQYAMTLITFHDGKVVMRDGKVGTGQGCCCRCCFSLIAVPNVVGFEPDAWGNCWKGIWEAIKSRLEGAGWVVTITEGQGQDPFGNPTVAPVMNIEPCCSIDCNTIATNWNWDNGALTDQPDGLWVNIDGQEGFDCPGYGIGIQFGVFAIAGCCGLFEAYTNTQVPFFVNGVPDPNAFPKTSLYVPVCNPLP